MQPQLRSNTTLDPAAKRKITLLQLLGIPSILALFGVVLASSMGYLPAWMFAPAACAEAILGAFLLVKIHRRRNRHSPTD
jgi:carbon starvation protein CstA